MKIDNLNAVQNIMLTYTPAANSRSDKEEVEDKKDTLTLTEEAKQFLAKEKADKKVKQQSTESFNADFARFLSEQSSKKENKAVNMSKCFKIAARISNGDKVPMKDMKYLRENAPELYKNALLFKKINPKPKKYKSCLNKKDEESLGSRNNSLVEATVGADDAIALDLGE